MCTAVCHVVRRYKYMHLPIFIATRVRTNLPNTMPGSLQPDSAVTTLCLDIVQTHMRTACPKATWVTGRRHHALAQAAALMLCAQPELARWRHARCGVETWTFGCGGRVTVRRRRVLKDNIFSSVQRRATEE
jgi:hypothetical protein